MGNSKLMDIQITHGKLGGSQNKVKRDECEKDQWAKEEVGQRWQEGGK